MRQVSSSVSLLSRLERVRSLEGHRGCVNCCSFTQDGNTLITGSDDTSIKLWNWRSGVLDSTLPTLHSGNVFQARQLLHGMSDWIVSCAADGQVQLHSMEGGGEASLVLGFHTGRAHKISLNPVDANTFLSCGEDGLVLSYDTRSKSSRQVVAFFSERGRRVPLNSVVHNPLDPNKFALAGGDNFVRIYDARMLPNPIEKLTPFTDETKRIGLHITCLEYSSVGELLATYSEDFIYLWSNRHDQEVDRPKKFSGHLNCETVKGVSFFGPNDDFVLSGSDDGHVFIWSKDTCKLLQLLKADKDIVNCLTPHPDLTTLTLATSGLEHNAKIWQPTANESTVPDESYTSDLIELNKKSLSQTYVYNRELLEMIFQGGWENPQELVEMLFEREDATHSDTEDNSMNETDD